LLKEFAKIIIFFKAFCFYFECAKKKRVSPKSRPVWHGQGVPASLKALE
jgi:hypothetical protein